MLGELTHFEHRNGIGIIEKSSVGADGQPLEARNQIAWVDAPGPNPKIILGGECGGPETFEDHERVMAYIRRHFVKRKGLDDAIQGIEVIKDGIVEVVRAGNIVHIHHHTETVDGTHGRLHRIEITTERP